ncbi:TPA: hypothetical protein PXM90_002269 [Yersinia enterocolitica]|nr:hypothetical protein [Yersinia enterocolitica]HDL7000504.1 hypothetical protein [Yersinia enterocolitica]HDL7108344.1 hypothetical protein [Yersinia enterocolitica]HDL7116814.1 hypothetical protein [Yersinia enterocolitica]
MTETAFSKSLKKEVDPEQYVELLGIDESEIHAFAHQDVICPICETTGGTYVRASKSGNILKKAHFRFNGEEGESAHDPSCDFYGDRLSNEVGQHLVRFATDRTKITHVIRNLVCAGIQAGVFSQESMRLMRQWFFKKRAASTFSVQISDETLGWLEFIIQLQRYPYASLRDDLISFGPAQTTIPGFSWKEAIQREAVRIHQPTLRKLNELKIWPKHIIELHKFVTNSSQRLLIDPTLLRDEYAKTLQLTSFIVNNYKEFKNKAVRDKADGEVKLLAFSALLLFVSNWNIERAVDKFAVIANITKVDDLLAGNFIGLNPYLKFSIADTARKIQESGPVHYQEIELWQVEKGMRDSYEIYSCSSPTPLPPLGPDIYISAYLKKEEFEKRVMSMVNNYTGDLS